MASYAPIFSKEELEGVQLGSPRSLHHKKIEKIEKFNQWGKFLSMGVLFSVICFLFYSLDLDKNYHQYETGFALTALTVPLTYGLGGRWCFGETWSFFQPMLGGFRFIIAQFFAWLFFTFSQIAGGTCLLYKYYWHALPPWGLSVAAGTLSFTSEILIVSSLFLFATKAHPSKEKTFLEPVPTRFSSTKQLWYLFLFMNVALSLVAMVLSILLVIYEERGTSAILLGILVTGSISVTVPLTYGLGGRWRHYRSWSFWQPFAGGFNFIVLQTLSWTLFSFVLLFFIIWIGSLFIDIHYPANQWIVSAGLCGFFAEIIMIFSLFTFQVPNHAEDIKNLSKSGYSADESPRDYEKRSERLSSLRYRLWTAFLITMLYNMQSIAILFIVLPFTLFSLKWAVLSTIAWMSVYSITFRKSPSFTGWRKWSRLRRSKILADCISDYFNNSIIKTAPLDPNKQYLFGYHPHGIIPAAALWMPLTSMFKHIFPQVKVVPLSATIIHYTPLIRDVFQWMGGRDVSRATFEHVLASGLSPLVVPGGQAELILSSSSEQIIQLVSRHKGFLRLALKYKVDVVPMFCFGETETLDNIRMPKLQRKSIKLFGFPIPWFPFGRWGLPIPRPVKMTLVVGQPIEIQPIILKAKSLANKDQTSKSVRLRHGENESNKQTDRQTEEALEILHKTYFDQLVQNFNNYKNKLGYEDFDLQFKDD